MERYLAMSYGKYYLLPLTTADNWGDIKEIKNEFIHCKEKMKIKGDFLKLSYSEIFQFIQKNHSPYFCRKRFLLDYDEKDELNLTKLSVYQWPAVITDLVEYIDPKTKESAQISYDYDRERYQVTIFDKSKRSHEYYFGIESEAKCFADNWIEKRKIRTLLSEV